jgi:voltage-gated potassium channel
MADLTARIRGNERALQHFEQAVAFPMLVLSLAVVPLLLIPLLARDLSPGVRTTLLALDWAIWAAFLAEYGIRLYLAPYKKVFVRSNLFDLLIVLLPFLRPLRVVRSARAARLLQEGRAMSFLGRASQSAREILTRHKLHYVLLAGIGAVLIGAAVTREFEQSAPGSTIKTFSDALWWATSTAVTVGSTTSPVTPPGRVVAVVLMLFGLGVFGLLAASFASFFIGERNEEEVEPKIREALDRLARIEAALQRLEDQSGETGGGPRHAAEYRPGDEVG